MVSKTVLSISWQDYRFLEKHKRILNPPTRISTASATPRPIEIPETGAKRGAELTFFSDVIQPGSFNRSGGVSVLPNEFQKAPMTVHTADPAAPPPPGLGSDEAERRLGAYGPNAVAEEPARPFRRIAEKFWAPVPWMLEAAILLQLAIGEQVEAAFISLLLVLNAAIGLIQEGRANRALAALKSKLTLTASVRRDGQWVKLPSDRLVPGDIVKISLGAIVPADLRLTSGAVLVDQSMLTGESVPVEAGAGAVLYAGGIIRRGEAVAEVTATGAHTYFGRAAELVRIAHHESAEQKAVFGLVRNLAALNGAIVILMIAYAYAIGMPPSHFIALVLTAILASIPVALPATFTLAAALTSRKLAARGALATRLAAVNEIASMDVLCADKTGTLTKNALRVDLVRPFAPTTSEELLAFAALASSEGGQDPVDEAIRHAAQDNRVLSTFTVASFEPFDPALKRTRAIVLGQAGEQREIIKGAPHAMAAVASIGSDALRTADEMAAQGHRILAVAAGAPGKLALIGLIGLSDPPRQDSAGLIGELRGLGVTTIMVTGDAPATAASVAQAVGLGSRICPADAIANLAEPTGFDVYAGVFPEDKFRLVRKLQQKGHVVGMCGDGANDAAALRQAQVGIAVSTATDVAKSAAAIVLTAPGLAGIVDAVKEGRATAQRILTYTLNALLKKIETVLFLAAGLVMTGHLIITPMFMVLFLVVNDLLTMSLTTDRAFVSEHPVVWRLRSMTILAVVLGLCKLAFSSAVLAAGKFLLGLDLDQLRTLAFIVLILGGQAIIFSIRERRPFWRSRPSGWLLASSAVTFAIAAILALGHVLMAPLPLGIAIAVLVATMAFGLAIDAVKLALFKLFVPA